VLRRLWSDELVTFDGTWHHLDRIRPQPMPVQRADPDLDGSFVGRVVEKVVRRIARLATGGSADGAGRPRARRRAAARLRRRGGRDPASLGIECSISIKAGDSADR